LWWGGGGAPGTIGEIFSPIFINKYTVWQPSSPQTSYNSRSEGTYTSKRRRGEEMGGKGRELVPHFTFFARCP